MSTPAGVFLACLVLFVQELNFVNNSLLGVGIVVTLLRLSSGVTAGARARAAALLVMGSVSLVASGVVVCPKLFCQILHQIQLCSPDIVLAHDCISALLR